MWEFNPLLLLLAVAPLGIFALLKMLRDPKLALYVVLVTAPVTRSLGGGTFTRRLTISELAGILFLFCFLYKMLKPGERSFRASRIDTRAALLLLVALLSAALGSFASEDQAWIVESIVLLYLMTFCLGVEQVLKSDADVEGALRVWFGIAAIVTAIGLWDSVGHWLFHLPKLFSGKDPFRPIATFRNSAQLSIYLFTTFFVALSSYFLPHLRPRDRGFLLILMTGILIVIPFASRRSIFVAFLAGITVVGFLRIRYLKGIIALAAMALIGGTVVIKTLEANQTLFEFSTGRLEVLTPGSLQQNPFLEAQLAGTWEAFMENPILGVGFGQYGGSDYDFIEDISGFSAEVHSTYLQVLAETGLVGFTAYLLFLFMLIRFCYETAFKFKDPRWAQFSMTLLGAFGGFIVSYGYNRHLRERMFWTLTGLIVCIHRLARHRYKQRRGQALRIQQGLTPSRVTPVMAQARPVYRIKRKR